MKETKNTRGFTIKRKILTITLSLTLLSILFLSVGAIYEFTSNTKEDFKNKSDIINNSVNMVIESKFNDIENDMDTVISNLDVNNKEMIRDKVRNIQENQPDTQLVYFYDEEVKKLETYPVTDTQSIDPETREWYINAKKSNDEFCITDSYVDPLLGDNIVTISKAVMKNGQFKGVLSVDYNLKNLVSSISSIKFGESGGVAITDQKGLMIANTSNNLEGSDSTLNTELWKEVSQHDSGDMFMDLNSESYKINYSTIPETNWKMIIQVPKGEYNNARNKFINVVVVIAALALIASIIDSMVFSKKLSNKINKVNEAISRGSNGDFSKDVDFKSNDELGEMAKNFNNMQKNISKLISMTGDSVKNVDESSNTLGQMSEQVSKAMNDVSATITEISKGSMESAQNLELLLSNLDNVSKQINEINNFSESIEKLALETDKLSKDGLDVINIVMDKSKETKRSTSDVTKVVLDVEESVKNIAVMNETISQITEQTNLLALNAAIEAARAGESGKGFAVVADEIRELAEQTSISAKNIDDVINNVVGTVGNAVKHVEETSSIVDVQQDSVISAKGIFDNINNQVDDLTNHLTNIIKNIKSVNENKDSIVTEAESISSIVQQTAAGTEEVTATTEEVTASTEDVVTHVEKLKELSCSLNNEISKFRLQGK